MIRCVFGNKQVRKMRQETGSEFWVRIFSVSQNEVRKKEVTEENIVEPYR